MNATATAELFAPGTDIVAQVEANPVMVLTDREKFNRFYDEMKRETDALEIDLTTERGRKAIASMAYKVARTKTAIDEAGKKLNEEWRARINSVDESRREIRHKLDELKEEVRRPLTEWEEAEEKRVDSCKQMLTLLRDSASVGYDETAADVRKRLAHIEGLTFNETDHAGYLPQLQALQQQTVGALNAAAERLDREETERAELERLRAEAAERERQEQERREAEEARRRQEEAEKAEAERKAAAESAEKERLEAAAKAAEEKARQEAERKAQEDRAAAERAHQEELAAEKRRADALEAEQRRQREEAERLAAEQARREADRAHRGRIMAAAKEAIMEAGAVDDQTAKNIVLAIVGGSVPNVTIRF